MNLWQYLRRAPAVVVIGVEFDALDLADNLDRRLQLVWAPAGRADFDCAIHIGDGIDCGMRPVAHG